MKTEEKKDIFMKLCDKLAYNNEYTFLGTTMQLNRMSKDKTHYTHSSSKGGLTMTITEDSKGEKIISYDWDKADVEHKKPQEKDRRKNIKEFLEIFGFLYMFGASLTVLLLVIRSFVIQFFETPIVVRDIIANGVGMLLIGLAFFGLCIFIKFLWNAEIKGKK